MIPAISIVLTSCLFVGIALATAVADGTSNHLEKGETLYDYYCYQCHGYSGDAKTLASTYLKPSPRDFTAADPSRLSFSEMVDAVAHGRANTGMVSFSRVLNPEEINSLVAYVRSAFMQDTPIQKLYHSTENGWVNHKRYALAFPFANGKIPLDTPWGKLDEKQRLGKQLYMNACISCHDRASVQSKGPVWELRALSFPRKHYSNKQPQIDAVSGASPYTIHDQIPDVVNLSDAALRGEHLFQENCAFCHAADGTGRNWIGSFLERRPRDLTDGQISKMNEVQLQEIILAGIPGSSMPAWRSILNPSQIHDIIAYIRQSLAAKTAESTISERQP